MQRFPKTQNLRRLFPVNNFFFFLSFRLSILLIITILLLGCLEHDIGKRLSVKEILDVFKSNINEIVSPIEEKKETQAKPMKLSQPKSKNLKMENVFL